LGIAIYFIKNRRLPRKNQAVFGGAGPGIRFQKNLEKEIDGAPSPLRRGAGRLLFEIGRYSQLYFFR
jgi:hypothetical protein